MFVTKEKMIKIFGNIKAFFGKAAEKMKPFFGKVWKFLKTVYYHIVGIIDEIRERRYRRDLKRGYSINWGKALIHSVKIGGSAMLRVLSYIVNILITVLMICLTTGIIVCVVFVLYLKTNIDPTLDIDTLTTGQAGTTMFYVIDETGNYVELEEERIHGGENRIWASYSEIPEDLVNAFIAIEDHRFWDHQGVDWYRTAAAVTQFFGPSGSSFGGSTITQQTIKNVTGEDDYSIHRKIQEIFRALYVETKLSKEEIMETYLNTIYLSQRCYGVKTAADTYFGKDVSQLSLVECAALASIVKYPTKYDPVQNPQNNLERRNTVLKTMYSLGMITYEEFYEAWDKELVIAEDEEDEKVVESKVSSDYIDAAIEDIISDLMEEKGVTREIASNMLYSGGYKVYLCMDPEVQRIMEQCYLDEDTFPVEDTIIKPQSAMVVCDPDTGDVLGIIGRRGEKTASRLLNYATQTRRSPGSSIKPIAVYGPAVELGLVTWATVVDDTPVEFYETTTWPNNVNRTYTGLQNIGYAIEESLNTVSVKVLQMVTVERSYEFLLKMGIHNLETSYTSSSGVEMTDLSLAPLALGATTIGLTVREMASAYTTFTNGGLHLEGRTYYKVVDSAGETVLNNKQDSDIVFSEGTCAVMTKMMERVVADRRMTIDSYTAVAGKTGTSMYEYDKWFCGFTPYYVGAVWYGFEQPAVLPTFRVFAPVYIFDNVMTALHQNMYDEAKAAGEELIQNFETTADIVAVKICLDSGMLYDEELCGHDLRGDRSEIGYFVNGTQPTTKCTRHVLVDFCAETGAIASKGCYHRVQHALVLETERAFPFQVYVDDAQYMYRPLEEGTEPYLSTRYPFYWNSIPDGQYTGLTYKADPAVNSYCSKHHLQWEQEENGT